ncbi:hypothetical protein [Nonomuraea africana]|uniref:Uncharacterized protein n=1 Tax=Nonomuraea africana TaxID=46171 RepID=A0ABR9KCX9_9ACTN|nr:hypothetical protein [Nonomuraea africana]MBE1559795.1 hypothetical protein [Nonomuraea africana]
MKMSDWPVAAAGVLVTLGVITLAGFAVAQLGAAEPSIITGVFAGLAAVLAAIPPIIKAIRGRR